MVTKDNVKDKQTCFYFVFRDGTQPSGHIKLSFITSAFSHVRKPAPIFDTY